ncbi:Bcr/CflA family multidrug efflux MFS transporter [Aeromonas molluscorum]|uniref:Bcr/CflA family multidrug efflux MFS transporter n=1 Tax=Aeromonas molluscorum TaxID=271417 RepID=UPI003F19740D
MPQTPLSPRFLFILLGALAGLTPLAVDMYLPAIPNIAHDLGTSIDGAQLTISAFLGGFAIGQLFYGPLADSFGRKPVILAGLVMFSIASVGCALADSLPELLAFRMLQAAGGAAGSVVVNALLRDMFEKDAFSRAMSFVILVMTLAPLVAPIIGGYISAHASWRLIFWLLVAISLLICMVMQWKIQETLKPELRQPLRLGQILRNYWGVLSHRRAMGYVLCGALSSSGMFAFLSGSPYVYIEYFHVPTQHYGWLFGLNILLMMLVTFANSRLVKGLGSERMLQYGLTVLPLAGLLLVYNAWSESGGLWGIVIPIVLFVGHISLVGANAMTGLLGHFQQAAGTASALAGTLRFGIGALVGILVNLDPPQSPLPMAIAIAGCGLGATLCYWLLAGRRPAVS